MTNYYDPVAHWIQILAQRVVQFMGLTMLLSMVIWTGLLHWYFPDSTWTELVRWTWDLISHNKRHWRTVYVMCLMLGTVFTGWLFTTISLRRRLQSGDRHHRGSRVVHYEQD